MLGVVPTTKSMLAQQSLGALAEILMNTAENEEEMTDSP